MILLVGNWKMAPEKAQTAIDLAKKTAKVASTNKKHLSIVVCPPYIHIPTVVKASKMLLVGGQSVAGSTSIAQTGMVNAAMLKSYGATYCIVGHSESRARGETNEMVQESVTRLFEKKIKPIVCVGERERDGQGWYLSEVKEQLETMLVSVPKASLKQLVIAYEPVWAIGAKAEREATALECCEMIIFIRKILSDTYGEKLANAVTILYGGSVDEHNAKTFITEGGAQGLLVGRVSLEPKRFTTLAKSLI